MSCSTYKGSSCWSMSLFVLLSVVLLRGRTFLGLFGIPRAALETLGCLLASLLAIFLNPTCPCGKILRIGPSLYSNRIVPCWIYPHG